MSPLTASAFEGYLYALSWSPQFCADQPDANVNPQCKRRLSFVTHGLWPDSSSLLSFCAAPKVSTAELAPYATLFPSEGLMQYQWRKHGSCSQLTPQAYFSLVSTLSKKLSFPSGYLKLQRELSQTRDQLVTAFRSANPWLIDESVAPFCDRSQRYLREVRICLNRSGQGAQKCPQKIAAQSSKSCAAQFSLRAP